MPNNTRNEPYMTRRAREIAAKHGISGSGHNDELDTFRHAYWSAMTTFYGSRGISEMLGNANEMKGDIINNQPIEEKIADQINNRIARDIAHTSQNPEEIENKIVEAIRLGKMIIKPDINDPRIQSQRSIYTQERPFDGFNDDQYSLPEDGAPPQFPMPESFKSEPNDKIFDEVINSDLGGLNNTDSFGESSGGFFSGIGGFFSGIGSGIAGFFGGGSGVGSTPLIPFPARVYKRASGISPADLMRHQMAQKSSTLDIDKILSDAVAKNADSLVDRLLAKNPNMFQKTLGRVLVGSLETFTSEIRKSKTRSIEEAFGNVLSGSGGRQLATNIGAMAAGEIVNYGMNEIFHRERTRVRIEETERSRKVREGLRLSEGQQAAALLRAIQKGQRNL